MRLRGQIKEVKLNHEYYTISRKTTNQNKFIVGDREKYASLISLEGNIINEYEFEAEIESLDYDDETKIIAIVYDNSLCLYDCNTEKLFQQFGMYKSVLIQNKKLWCVKTVNKKKAILEIYNLDDFSIQTKLEIEDIFVHSGFILLEGFDENSIILWMAAGQDGQLNYTISLDKGILFIKEIGDFDTYPIRISPDKTSYINFDKELMGIYSIFRNNPLRNLNFDLEADDLYNSIYLSNEQILFQSYENLKVYNKKFDSLNEVTIFKPNYKSLKSVHDKVYSYKDFNCIERIGNQIIVPYKKNEILIATISDFEYRLSNQLQFEFTKRSL